MAQDMKTTYQNKNSSILIGQEKHRKRCCFVAHVVEVVWGSKKMVINIYFSLTCDVLLSDYSQKDLQTKSYLQTFIANFY